LWERNRKGGRSAIVIKQQRTIYGTINRYGYDMSCTTFSGDGLLHHDVTC
jgi:hypothetical protein